MLNFGSTIPRKLKLKSSNAHWLLKLYYNDESDFIGLSDSTRDIGGVTYHGLATWGSYTQSADILNFSASQGSFSVTINNTDKAILGHRFSDFFATKKFDNRKWELKMESDNFQSSGFLGTGVISSDILHDDLTITFRLLHEEFDLPIPTSSVTSGSAPEANRGAAIPYAYGETRPTSTDTTVNLDRLTVVGLFPAIVVDSRGVTALPDVQALGELNTRWVAIRDGKTYAYCLPANTTVDATTNPEISIVGTNYKIPLALGPISDPLALSTNRANAVDQDLSTVATFVSQADGNTATYDIEIDPLIGDSKVLDVLISINNSAVFTAHTTDARLSYSFDGNTFNGNSQDLLVVGAITDDTLGISGVNLAYPTTKGVLRLTLNGDVPFVDQASMTTKEITAELKISPKNVFLQNLTYTTYTLPGRKATNVTIENDNKVYGGESKFQPNPTPTKIEFTTKATPDKTLRKYWKTNAPADLEYIFYAGKGRVAGAWIQSGRSNGYSTGNALNNPIYIAESLIRDEAGLTNVDIGTFDISGDATAGRIKDVFDLTPTNVKFALAQKQFTTLFSELNKIGSQCGTLFFISADGNIKSKTRWRRVDYSSSDMVVLYSDISPVQAYHTSINDVRNSITTSYAADYSTDQLTEITSEDSDGTSQGTTVAGYGEILTFEDAAPFILDADTASGLNSYTLDLRKDQKRVIQFTTSSPRYQILEIGDTINFKSWPSDYKVLGISVAEADIWMINSITKSGPDFTRIQVQQVSD